MNQEQEHKLRTRHSKSANPDFGGELLQFPGISTVEALSFVRWVYLSSIWILLLAVNLFRKLHMHMPRSRPMQPPERTSPERTSLRFLLVVSCL